MHLYIITVTWEGCPKVYKFKSNEINVLYYISLIDYAFAYEGSRDIMSQQTWYERIERLDYIKYIILCDKYYYRL